MPLPWMLLAGVTLALVVVWAVDRDVGRRRARRLRRLAERCGFHYSRVDRFSLATRIGPQLPASDGEVVVRDLMYRSDPGGYVYAFTAVHPHGLLVLHAREPAGDPRLQDVRRSDPALPLAEQYRRLLHESGPLSRVRTGEC